MPNPTQRAFRLARELVRANGFQPPTVGDIEDAANEAVCWVNERLDNAEQSTSIDEVTAEVGQSYGINAWE